MKYSIAILLLIGAITLEDTTAISLERNHHHHSSHQDDSAGKKKHKHKKGKGHHKHKQHKNSADSTTGNTDATTTGSTDSTGQLFQRRSFATPARVNSLQTQYDHWTDENNDKSNNVQYVNDQPANYAVEPMDIDLQTNTDIRYDHWTDENNDKSNNVAYVND